MQEPENKASINSKYAVSIGYHLKAQKWSKAAFSRRLGKSPAYIYLILNGKVSPSIAVFERTLEILDLTPSKFYRVREPETELAEKEMAMMRKMAESQQLYLLHRIKEKLSTIYLL